MVEENLAAVRVSCQQVNVKFCQMYPEQQHVSDKTDADRKEADE